MSEKNQDILIVRDASGRRSFMRRGAAFVMGSAAMTSSITVLADDCDRGFTDSRQKQATAGSDSDLGANADPAGCGRKKDEVPARFIRQPGEDHEIPDVVPVDGKSGKKV